jgi:hypothetical protein
MSNTLKILQHSLGLDQYGQGNQHRCHFVTDASPKNTAHRICMQAVADGLMTRRDGNALTGGDDVFFVTPAGVEFVRVNSPKPPKVSRAKARYRRWLENRDYFHFDGFLDFCRWDALPTHEWNKK